MKELKEILLQEDNLIKVLEHFEYCNIKETSKEIRCSVEEGLNASSMRIKKNENISSQDFGRDLSGDILSLIIEHRNLEFKEVIRQIKSLLGLSLEYKPKQKSTFQALFSKIKTNNINAETKAETYPESTLNNYEKVWNERFAKDNISIETQIQFDIGYCNETNRITIPWRNTEGELVGIMGRDNTDMAEGYKYLPLIPFPKSLALYGYSENYKHLVNAEVIYIFESEKSVLQAHTMGYYNCIALGGNALSEYQIKAIISLNPKLIVFGFDEGLSKELIKQKIKQMQSHLILRETKVGIIMDFKNKYMKKGSKCSPTDMGKEIFEKLINECTYTR